MADYDPQHLLLRSQELCIFTPLTRQPNDHDESAKVHMAVSIFALWNRRRPDDTCAVLLRRYMAEIKGVVQYIVQYNTIVMK